MKNAGLITLTLMVPPSGPARRRFVPIGTTSIGEAPEGSARPPVAGRARLWEEDTPGQA